MSPVVQQNAPYDSFNDHLTIRVANGNSCIDRLRQRKIGLRTVLFLSDNIETARTNCVLMFKTIEPEAINFELIFVYV